MSQRKSQGNSVDPELRRRDEERLVDRRTEVSRLSSDEIAELVHELEVHQIELEMQNQNLREAEFELAEARDRYLDLYEFAPVGYLTLDESLGIREANLKACALLGVERSKLIGHPLPRFFYKEDAAICYHHFRRAAEREEETTSEVRVLRQDGSGVQLRMATQSFGGGPNAVSFRTTLTDVTELRQALQRLDEFAATLEGQVAERTAELKDRSARLERLALELTEAEERERRRLAAILHDDLQQNLAALRFMLKTVVPQARREPQAQATISEAEKIIDRSLERMRSLSRDLAAPVLAEDSIPKLLKHLAREASKKHGLDVTVEAGDGLALESQVVTALVARSLRELLFNVAKHSGAGSAHIEAHRNAESVEISVTDSGKGFDNNQPQKSVFGLGLTSVEDRITSVGGRLKIETGPGQGCRVILSVPISRG